MPLSRGQFLYPPLSEPEIQTGANPMLLNVSQLCPRVLAKSVLASTMGLSRGLSSTRTGRKNEASVSRS